MGNLWLLSSFSASLGWIHFRQTGIWEPAQAPEYGRFPCFMWRALLQLMVEHKGNLCKNPAGGTVEGKRLSGSISLLLTQTEVGLETWSWGQSCLAIGETKIKPPGQVSLSPENTETNWSMNDIFFLYDWVQNDIVLLSSELFKYRMNFSLFTLLPLVKLAAPLVATASP